MTTTNRRDKLILAVAIAGAAVLLWWQYWPTS